MPSLWRQLTGINHIFICYVALLEHCGAAPVAEPRKNDLRGSYFSERPETRASQTKRNERSAAAGNPARSTTPRRPGALRTAHGVADDRLEVFGLHATRVAQVDFMMQPNA